MKVPYAPLIFLVAACNGGMTTLASVSGAPSGGTSGSGGAVAGASGADGGGSGSSPAGASGTSGGAPASGGEAGSGGVAGASGSGTGGSAAGAGGCTSPPCPPSDAVSACSVPTQLGTTAPPTKDRRLFGVTDFFFGDVDWSGAATDNGWRLFGLNLDGADTAAPSSSLCQACMYPFPSNDYVVDGACGSDNAVGEVIALSAPAGTLPSAFATMRARGGDWTISIEIDGLGANADQNGVTGLIGVLPPTHVPLKFDGTDSRPVWHASDTHPEFATFSGYVTGNRLVATAPPGSSVTVVVPFPPAKPSVDVVYRVLVLDLAGVVLDLDAARTHVTSGLIAGSVGGFKGMCILAPQGPLLTWGDLPDPANPDCCGATSWGIGVHAVAIAGGPDAFTALPTECDE